MQRDHWYNAIDVKKPAIFNIEMIPTVRYSPQLNYLVECYFGIIKSLLGNIDIPPVVDENY